MSRAPAPSGNPIFAGDLRVKFTLGADKKVQSKLYLYSVFIYVKPCIAYGVLLKHSHRFKLRSDTDSGRGQGRPRLDHERFRPSQPSRGKGKCSSFFNHTTGSTVQACHTANVERIDPRLITKRRSAKLGLFIPTALCSALRTARG